MGTSKPGDTFIKTTGMNIAALEKAFKKQGLSPQEISKRLKEIVKRNERNQKARQKRTEKKDADKKFIQDRKDQMRYEGGLKKGGMIKMKKGGRVSNGPGGIAIKGISPILRSGK